MRYIVMLGDILNLIKILTLSTTIIYLLIIQQLISIDHFYGDMLIIQIEIRVYLLMQQHNLTICSKLKIKRLKQSCLYALTTTCKLIPLSNPTRDIRYPCFIRGRKGTPDSSKAGRGVPFYPKGVRGSLFSLQYVQQFRNPISLLAPLRSCLPSVFRTSRTNYRCLHTFSGENKSNTTISADVL